MFKLAKEFDVWWPVTIPVPADGGIFKKQQIECQYRIGHKSALEVTIDQEAEAMIGVAAGGPAPSSDALASRLVGVKGVHNEAGEELPFTTQLRNDLLGIPYVRAAIFSAYVEACTGRAGIRKN